MGFDRGKKWREPSPPTFLMVANYPPDVGYAWWLMENFWVELAEVVKQQNLRPVLIYPSSGSIPAAITDAGLDVWIEEFPPNGYWKRTRFLQFVVKNRVRGLYLTDRAFRDPYYFLLRMFGVRVIINHDHTPGDRPPIGGIKGILKHLVNRIAFFTADLQMCVSPFVKERAQKNARIPGKRIAVVQNGIRPLDCEHRKKYAYEKLDIPASKKLCISVGRAHPYKRIDFVIEVARQYVQEIGREDIVFLHCGDGPDLLRLVSLVEKNGITAHFKLLGRRSDVRELLCSSHFAIHPSKGEAFSLAILEYMSAGLAVFVPEIRSVSQAVVDGKTGVVFREDDPGEVAERLAELALDERGRKELGSLASKEVGRIYSLEKTNHDFRATVSILLEKKRFSGDLENALPGA